MNEKVVAKGKIFELIQIPKPDGKLFEIARRAPGVRLIIPSRNEGTVLLTKEFRHELNNWDYRLPGGKVFDTLDEYETHRQKNEDILSAAVSRAKGEGAEEAGIDIKDVKLFKKSTLGATVEWDLFVFEVTDWQAHADGQKLEEGEFGEHIDNTGWFSFSEAEQMILNGKMQEERVALILLQWLNGQK